MIASKTAVAKALTSFSKSVNTTTKCERFVAATVRPRHSLFQNNVRLLSSQVNNSEATKTPMRSEPSFGMKTTKPTGTVMKFGGLKQHDQQHDIVKYNNNQQQQIRTFAAATVAESLEKLDESVLKKIESELKEVDANKDGRLDTEELKQLLRKHHSAFTDEEIIEFGELYYAGKGGGSIPIQEFMNKLDKMAHDKDVHPILDGNCSAEYIYRKTHNSYTEEDLNIQLTHKPPENFSDRLAFNASKVVRILFDKATGWNYGTMTQEMVLNRVIFLETIAAVPGMVAAIARHFKSLRSMERDGGLMHVFLEEANNERMHLLSFIKMKNPSTMFRGAVVVSQFGFGSAFFLSYLISPKLCHRFVGYVEEEACSTYTKIIKAIEEAPEGSELAPWKTEVAPSIARGYWKLGENGSVLDLMYAVRADEAEHRDVNHACSELEHTKINPFNDPELKINLMLRKYLNDIMTRN